MAKDNIVIKTYFEYDKEIEGHFVWFKRVAYTYKGKTRHVNLEDENDVDFWLGGYGFEIVEDKDAKISGTFKVSAEHLVQVLTGCDPRDLEAEHFINQLKTY
jgi:hypothetical protein